MVCHSLLQWTNHSLSELCTMTHPSWMPIVHFFIALTLRHVFVSTWPSPLFYWLFKSWFSIYKPFFLHINLQTVVEFFKHLAGIFIHFALHLQVKARRKTLSSPLVFSRLSYFSWLLDPFTPSDKGESEDWGCSCPRREHGSLGLNNPSEWVSRGPSVKFGCCFLPGSLTPSEGGGSWRYVTESLAFLYISVESNSWRQSFGCSRKGESRQHIKKQRHYFADQGLSSQSYGFSSSCV